MRIPATALGVMGLVAMLAVAAFGQKSGNATSALINEALDKNVNLNVNNVLPAVLKGIEEKTGVRIIATDAVYDLLPWGEQTNIKATVEHQTLRAALTAMTQKLGLIWELGQFEVVLKPMPALARLGRRATITEIQTLELLRTTNFAGGKQQMTAQELLRSIDQQLAKIKTPPVVLDIRSGDPGDTQSGFIQLDKTINVPRDSHISVVLEDIVRQSNGTWYPWGTKIVVVPKQQLVRMQLENKSITKHFNGTDIGRVLDELSAESGVPFQVEPGAFQRVPAQYRSIRLDLENATVRQALEDIRGVTGLDYVVKSDGIYVWNQNGNQPGLAAAATDPVVAIIQTETGVQMMVRDSELPADVRALLAHKRQEWVQKLAAEMKAENFVPTTQPATQP